MEEDELEVWAPAGRRHDNFGYCFKLQNTILTVHRVTTTTSITTPAIPTPPIASAVSQTMAA